MITLGPPPKFHGTRDILGAVEHHGVGIGLIGFRGDVIEHTCTSEGAGCVAQKLDVVLADRGGIGGHRRLPQYVVLVMGRTLRPSIRVERRRQTRWHAEPLLVLTAVFPIPG